eukprot:CAMPEP_0204917702 /NCGR_PEP_ID=MMETSP1397-20131031/15324_1 /ASSEMBLY_ACC=CAM_ASM_000891 /TAXON_ID=49980 /ORGANISM="Climacostomum Climacostomum virens, Strain Stock W-24" /LENGTH=56 /DNA_ID=CAMNT_0052090623 /DNA_START=320 /DNA_END=490 /DNA_ORIENTATION=+
MGFEVDLVGFVDVVDDRLSSVDLVNISGIQRVSCRDIAPDADGRDELVPVNLQDWY